MPKETNKLIKLIIIFLAIFSKIPTLKAHIFDVNEVKICFSNSLSECNWMQHNPFKKYDFKGYGRVFIKPIVNKNHTGQPAWSLKSFQFFRVLSPSERILFDNRFHLVEGEKKPASRKIFFTSETTDIVFEVPNNSGINSDRGPISHIKYGDPISLMCEEISKLLVSIVSMFITILSFLILIIAYIKKPKTRILFLSFYSLLTCVWILSRYPKWLLDHFFYYIHHDTWGEISNLSIILLMGTCHFLASVDQSFETMVTKINKLIGILISFWALVLAFSPVLGISKASMNTQALNIVALIYIPLVIVDCILHIYSSNPWRKSKNSEVFSIYCSLLALSVLNAYEAISYIFPHLNSVTIHKQEPISFVGVVIFISTATYHRTITPMIDNIKLSYQNTMWKDHVHKIKTNCTILIGTVEGIKPNGQESNLKNVNNILNETLDLSEKLNADPEKPSPEKINIKEFITKRAENKNELYKVAYNVTINPIFFGDDIFIYIDKEHFQSIIDEKFWNAVKHSKINGKIDLYVTCSKSLLKQMLTIKFGNKRAKRFKFNGFIYSSSGVGHKYVKSVCKYYGGFISEPIVSKDFYSVSLNIPTQKYNFLIKK